MPLRYHKQIKLGDFIKLNINKNSMSVSAGVPGVHFNVGPAGPMVNIDLPGGMSYRKYLGKSKKEKAEEARAAKQAEAAQTKVPRIAPPPPPLEPPGAEPVKAQTDTAAAEDLAALKANPLPARADTGPAEAPAAPPVNPVPARADTAPPAPAPVTAVPPEEAPFQLGFIAYQRGEYVQAYRHFTALIDTPYQADALFMAGITSIYLERDDEALTYLGTLLEEGRSPFPGEEDSLVARYLPGETINIQLTSFTSADLPLAALAALLLYVELLQADNQLDAAAAMQEEVFNQNPELRLVQLSLANLYFALGRYDDLYTLFSQHTPELKAEDDVAVEIMYYWAQALTVRQLYDEADKVYRRALARAKGINPDLRLMMLYACADLYERWGKYAQARKGFEHIFAEAPDYYDVQQRIAALTESQVAT